MPPALRLEHHVLLMHEAIKAVAPWRSIRKHLLYHQMHLVGSYARVLAADALHRLYYLTFAHTAFLAHRTADRVIALPAFAKQSAQTSDGFLRMPDSEGVYCLAPAFFSKSMPYCSRPIFNTSFNASLRSSEYSRALRRRAFSSRRRSSSLTGTGDCS